VTEVTLSFDNGPDPAVTPQVLDVLAKHGILATFFVVGKNLEIPENQALMARAHDAGHWIGNHTYSHSVPLGRLGAAAAIDEIDRTADLIGACTHPSRLFRPYGEGGILDDRILSADALNHLQHHGYSCITWNAVPRDWADPVGWVQTALAQIASRDASLLVLHDIPTGAMALLDTFIATTLSHGVTFRQEFPEECKLTWEGKPTRDLSEFVN
jgi:peptidoglycan/xylan/chitin deacetylase (PgdA/CDA1 family)